MLAVSTALIAKSNMYIYVYAACIGCQQASALAASRQALKRRSDHGCGDATYRRARWYDAVLWRSQPLRPPRWLSLSFEVPAS